MVRGCNLLGHLVERKKVTTQHRTRYVLNLLVFFFWSAFGGGGGRVVFQVLIGSHFETKLLVLGFGKPAHFAEPIIDGSANSVVGKSLEENSPRRVETAGCFYQTQLGRALDVPFFELWRQL